MDIQILDPGSWIHQYCAVYWSWQASLLSSSSIQFSFLAEGAWGEGQRVVDAQLLCRPTRDKLDPCCYFCVQCKVIETRSLWPRQSQALCDAALRYLKIYSRNISNILVLTKLQSASVLRNIDLRAGCMLETLPPSILFFSGHKCCRHVRDKQKHRPSCSVWVL